MGNKYFIDRMTFPLALITPHSRCLHNDQRNDEVNTNLFNYLSVISLESSRKKGISFILNNNLSFICSETQIDIIAIAFAAIKVKPKCLIECAIAFKIEMNQLIHHHSALNFR